MKEAFLHYLWKFTKYDLNNLETVEGEPLTILNPGQYLQLSGPDFFNAQIIIGGQKWAGNIEIHLKSSDWYHHCHEIDPAYENVILHVVWDHDTEIFNRDATRIPVLRLKDYTDPKLVDDYVDLLSPKSWIFCEKNLCDVTAFTKDSWLGRLFFERLEQKSVPVMHFVEANAGDWEAALYLQLAKNFGLNTNGDVFLDIARAIPFSVFRKIRGDPANIEALFYQFAGLLSDECEDVYFHELRNRAAFLMRKYRIGATHFAVEFFKHRPDNFPTIRISQFANLYHSRTNLFSDLVSANSVADYVSILKVPTTQYWETHYIFDKVSPKKRKEMTRAFIYLLVINAVIPLKFAFARYSGMENIDALSEFLEEIPPEKNAVIEKFAGFGLSASNAFESQALLQLKNVYCNNAKCLECAIGAALLKCTAKENA